MARIDLLFIRQSVRPYDLFFSTSTDFSRRSHLRLLLFIVPIAALIYMVWPTSGKDHQAVESPTLDERIQWSNFQDAIDETLQVQTLDDASQALTGLRHFVSYLPYKDERHERDANFCLATAENHLLACHTQGRTHPNHWRAELTEALATIPRYAGRLDNTPPPPIIDLE